MFALSALLACHLPPPGEAPVSLPAPARALVARHPDGPWVVAHRGASAYAPENTLASYREALARGAVAAETDVHLSLDRHVVVMHDPTPARTTGAPGAIAELPWDALRGLDAGAWFDGAFAGEPVPELGELLDLTRGRLVLCIEIKAGDGIVEAVRERVDARGMRGDVVVFSFDAAAVTGAKAAMPDVPAVWLARRPGQGAPYAPAVVDEARALGVDAVGFDHRALSAEVVAAAHAAGLPVFTWTVNAEADARRVATMGVDVLIGDAPDRVAGWVRR